MIYMSCIKGNIRATRLKVNMFTNNAKKKEQSRKRKILDKHYTAIECLTPCKACLGLSNAQSRGK